MADRNFDKQAYYGNVKDEVSIQSSNFGGLNVTASPLNVPFEDSPYMVNCIADVSGNIVKRKGTRMLYRDSLSTDGVLVMPYATGLEYNFLVTKRNKDLRIFEVLNDVATEVMVKSNVFSTRASTIRPNAAVTSEVEARILFMTGVDKPVQLKFVEQQTIQPSASTTVVVSNAIRFKNASVSNCLAFVDRVRTVPSSFTYNAGTKQLSVVFPGSIAANAVVDLISITWQWWAEGMYWTGNKLYQSTNRFNVTTTDQSVAVPPQLRSDLDPSATVTGAYGYHAFRRSSRTAGSEYPRVTNRQPQLEDEFGHADGSRYTFDTSNANYLNPSSLFITFGKIQTAYTGFAPVPTAGTSTNLYFTRLRQLHVNNETGIAGTALDVYVDGVKVSQATTAGAGADLVYKNYWLGDANGTDLTSTASSAFYIQFTTQQLGLPADCDVEWANNVATHIGTSALTTRYDYNDGSYEIMYGLGLYADYASGYYPSLVHVYQERIILSGFAHRPLALLFSGLSSTSVPGKPLNNFQITDDSQSDADAFDVVLSSKPDDRVVTSVEWQASLFVLTRKSVFRVTGSGNSVLTGNSRSVSPISNNGCVNSASVVLTATTVLYLSDNGLFDLQPETTNNEYVVRERSIKVRNKFGLTNDTRYELLPFVAYDEPNRYVIVGYPGDGEFYTNKYLYVYDTYRDSWTEFDTGGGFNSFGGCSYVDRLNGTKFLLAVCTERASSAPANFMLLKLFDDFYIDYRQQFTQTNGTPVAAYIPPVPQVFYSTSASQYRYSYNFASSKQRSAFNTVPVNEVQDLMVFYAPPGGTTQTLVQGTDFVKEQFGSIYLLFQPVNNSSLFIRQVSDDTNLRTSQLYGHLYVDVDNVKTTLYTLAFTETASMTLNTTPAVNSKVNYGQLYTACWLAPLFNMKQMSQYKVMKHVNTFFDNRDVNIAWTGSDVNTAAGQDPSAIVDGYKVKAGVNIGILYNSESSGETTADLYGFDDIFWDIGNFDTLLQNQSYQMFRESLQGVGYCYQLAVWTESEKFFKLAGYQLQVKVKGERYAGRN